MEECKYQLVFAPRAQADIEEIMYYITYVLCNPFAAIALNSKINEILDLVCYNPFMYPLIYSDLVKYQTMRKIVVDNYLVFYNPDETAKKITVFRIVYGRTDYERDIFN